MVAVKNTCFGEESLSAVLSDDNLKLIAPEISDVMPVDPDRKYFEWINDNGAVHHHREVMLVLSGTGYFTLGRKTYPCRPGNIFLIDSEVNHDHYYPPFFDNFKHLWFRIVSKTIFTCSPYVKLNGKVVTDKNFNYTFTAYSQSGQFFINAWNEVLYNSDIDDNLKSSYMKHAFAGLIYELILAGMKAGEESTELRHKTAINVITEHIRETGGKHLDIARLAYIAGYSKFHFARIFKDITGVSVLKFINLCRIDKFRELSQKGFSKKQISSELGFSCPAAFSRWQKNHKIK